MSRKGKDARATKVGAKRVGGNGFKRFKAKPTYGPKIYAPKVYSPTGVSSLVESKGRAYARKGITAKPIKANPAVATAARKRSAPLKSTKEEEMSHVNRKDGRKTVTKMPKNLNDIKNIKNNKIVCNNVMVDVEGCYEKRVTMDDLTEFPDYSMNDAEGSVVQWICEHGTGKTILVMMAWLSNKRILKCLVACAKRVLCLVNDEDYSGWTKTLMLYDKLPKFEEPLHSAFFGSKSLMRALDRDNLGNKFDKCTFEPVRCFGNSSFGSNAATSLMHLKVMIFFDEKRLPGGKIVEEPTSFITGSFNCTDNAPNSLENVVWIPSKKGAEHCFYQFSIVMAYSRPIRR